MIEVKIGVIVELAIIAIALDTVLGILRAIKGRELNSSFGINGVIRKIGMIVTIIAMMLVDNIVKFNLIGFVPKDILSIININRIGLSDLYATIYLLFEVLSILKNMTALKLPVFKKGQAYVEELLTKYTGEKPSDINK